MNFPANLGKFVEASLPKELYPKAEGGLKSILPKVLAMVLYGLIKDRC